MFTKSYFSIPAFLLLGCFSLSALAVNPNTATVDELAEELVGVGPKLAEKIVQYREENGNFGSLEDLMAVKGIGNSVIEKNRDQIEFEE